MFNRAPVRRLLLATGIGLALVGGPGLAAADPEEPVEAPQPGQVTAAATCARGTASITVTLDFEDAPLQVRLDRLSPDQASLTKTTAPHELDPLVQKVVFEPVPVGEYNVHVERARPDDVPVVVKPCGDPQPTDELLRVEVECQAGWGLVTFIVVNPSTDAVVEYTLRTSFTLPRKLTLEEGVLLRLTENGLDDVAYTAHLIGKDVDVVKEFTVQCIDGNAPRLAVTAACSGTTGTVTVDVLNPNRLPANYEVLLKDVIKKVTVNGGEKGSVAFAGIATGEHSVLVKGGDQTQARGVAKVECGTTTTTTPTTTTTTPVPQGGTAPQLANTGASVSGLVAVGVLVLGLGGALLMIGRRRARGN